MTWYTGKRSSVLFLGALVILAVFWLTNRNEIQTKAEVVRITDQGFVPQSITVKKGSKVEFINDTSLEAWPASDLHPTHGIYPEFDPREPLPTGASWVFEFSDQGSWRYHDHLKPNRRGLINVE
jgi:plastocyanin